MLKKDCVRKREEEKRHSECNEKTHILRWKFPGLWVGKFVVSYTPPARKIREKKQIGEVKRDRLQSTLKYLKNCIMVCASPHESTLMPDIT